MPVFNLPPEYFELTFDMNKGEVIVYHVLEKKDDSKIFTLEDLNIIIYEAQQKDGYPDLKFPFYTGGEEGHLKHHRLRK